MRCGPSGRRGSRSLRISTQVDGFSRPRAHAASVPLGLLLGLQLFDHLRHCGAVRARQAPRDSPGRERVFMVDGSEFATGQRSIDSAKGWWPASGDHPDRRLREILDASPRDDDSYRVFSAARFIRSTFEGDADFEQATFHISAFSEAAFRAPPTSPRRPSSAIPGSEGLPSKAARHSSIRPSQTQRTSRERVSRASHRSPEWPSRTPSRSKWRGLGNSPGSRTQRLPTKPTSPGRLSVDPPTCPRRPLRRSPPSHLVQTCRQPSLAERMDKCLALAGRVCCYC